MPQVDVGTNVRHKSCIIEHIGFADEVAMPVCLVSVNTSAGVARASELSVMSVPG